MAITSFGRYEEKFIITEYQKTEFLALIKDKITNDIYCPDGREYKVCNIYYDNERNDVIRNSIKKPPYKEKMRMRSYGIPKDKDSRVFLELKKKVHGFVLKRRVFLPLGVVEEFLMTHAVPDVIPTDCEGNTRQILSEIEYYLTNHPVSPYRFICYDRSAYYANDNKSLRITFDRNILSRSTDVNILSGAYGEPVIGENQYILEIKTSGNMPFWLTSALNQCSIYNVGFSKIGTAYINEKSSFIGRQNDK